jgi:hypothetical protein
MYRTKAQSRADIHSMCTLDATNLAVWSSSAISFFLRKTERVDKGVGSTFAIMQPSQVYVDGNLVAFRIQVFGGLCAGCVQEEWGYMMHCRSHCC